MSTTQTIEIKANDPVARELLNRSVKWMERIANRKDELPTSFVDGCDPAPLAKDIREYLSPAPLNCHVCKKPRPERSLMLCDECLGVSNDGTQRPPVVGLSDSGTASPGGSLE